MKYFYLTCVFLLLSVGFSFSEGSIRIIEPFGDNSTIRMSIQKNKQMEHVKRKGQIKLHVKDFFPQILSSQKDSVSKARSLKGHVMDISFFPDHRFKVLVDSDVRPQQNVLNVSGKFQSLESISTFSMTLTDESYLIFVRDLEKKVIYRAMGDAQNGAGEVIEYDMTKFPAMWDFPAFVR